MSLIENPVDSLTESIDTLHNPINETTKLLKRQLFYQKYKIHFFYVLIISLCLFNISINFYSGNGIQYENPSSIIKTSCNNSISNFTLVCPNRFNKCYLYSKDYTVYNWWNISLELFIMMAVAIELYIYKFKSLTSSLSEKYKSFLTNLNVWNKANAVILIWSCIYYFCIPILIYRNNDLCGADQTCDFKFNNFDCDEVNKYCDDILFKTCINNGTFTFNY